jgi:uncharacterized membrane protein
MNSLFWSRRHGGATHFPIALVFGAACFDTLAFVFQHSPKQREFRATGYWLIIIAALGSFGAVFSGLALSKWTFGGTGLVLRHHLFVWPSFALIVGLGAWRFLVGRDISRRVYAIYLGAVMVACACIAVAGFFGGEMLLAG